MVPIPVLFVFIACIGNIFLGLFTYFKNTKSATNTLLLLFSGILSVYLVLNHLSLNQSTSEATLYWLSLLMASIPILNLLFFFLVLIFPKTKLEIRPEVFYGSIVASIAVTLLGLAKLIFTGVAMTQGNIESYPGIGMPFFIAHIIVFLGGGFLQLILKTRKAVGTERKQLQLFLIGTIFMYAAILIFNFLVVLIFNSSIFVKFLPLYTLLFVGIISYAIIKHKFLDINLLVVRVVTYSLVIFLITLIYTSILFLIGRTVLDVSLSTSQQILFILLTVIIAVSFPEIKRLVGIVTDKFLFQGRYDSDVVVSKLTRGIASTIVLDELTHLILTQLKVPLKFRRAAFILFTGVTYGEINSDAESYRLTQEEVEMLKLNALETIVFDSLEEGKVKDLLRRMDIVVVAPIQTKNKYIGLFLIGPRESGDVYSDQDLRMVEIISSESAVAIQNALSFEEIRKFNVTLQEEIKKATSDLVLANERLKELDKLKDEFVSLASHELRSPMSGIKSSLSTILEGFSGEITKETRDMLTAAYSENDRLIRLVNNLLDTSRIESGKFTLNMSVVNMNAVIEEVIRNMQIAGKDKNIFIKYEKTMDLPDVNADEDKIKEILINLIGNAVKFTSQGGITVKAIVENGYIKVAVTDTGSGIHKEDFELLFQKFSQVNRDASKKIGGTGLGLYISKQIVEGHGGHIWLESEVGKGTTFYFTLPVEQKH